MICFWCGRPVEYDDEDLCWRDAEGEDLCPGAIYHHPAPVLGRADPL